MSKDRVSVRNLLWGCPTWFLADFFCPTCPTHLSHQSVPRLFPNWVDRTELDGRDGRFIWTAWNKRTRKIEKTQVTPPHNPEVAGSSPVSATMLSDRNGYTHLKPLRNQGFQPLLPPFFNARVINTQGRLRLLGRTWRKSPAVFNRFKGDDYTLRRLCPFLKKF